MTHDDSILTFLISLIILLCFGYNYIYSKVPEAILKFSVAIFTIDGCISRLSHVISSAFLVHIANVKYYIAIAI